MTAESFFVLGWSIPQWRKAVEYHDQLNPTTPIGVSQVPRLMCGALEAGPYRQLVDVQNFWRHRRIDQPLDVTILLA